MIPRALVLWRECRRRRTLCRAIVAAGCRVECTGNWERGQSLAHDIRLVVLDLDQPGDDVPLLLQQAGEVGLGRPYVLAVSANPAVEHIASILELGRISNLIVGSARLERVETAVTAVKIIQGNIFGMEKYLAHGCSVSHQIVSSSEHKMACIAGMRGCLAKLGVNSRLIENSESIADELITNAVYNAPTDTRGAPKYATRSRRDSVSLSNREAIHFSYATDGSFLAICAADNFGRLDFELARFYLTKSLRAGPNQVDPKQGGAGLGLGKILCASSSLIVNLAPGRRTEVIAIIDISGSFREFSSGNKSLHFFVEGGLQ